MFFLFNNSAFVVGGEGGFLGFLVEVPPRQGVRADLGRFTGPQRVKVFSSSLCAILDTYYISPPTDKGAWCDFMLCGISIATMPGSPRCFMLKYTPTKAPTPKSSPNSAKQALKTLITQDFLSFVPPGEVLEVPQ